MKSIGAVKIYFKGIFFLFCMLSSLKAETNYLDKINFQPIAKEQITETLEVLSIALRANYEQIKSWQADVDVNTEQMYYGIDAQTVFKEKTKSNETPPQSIKRLTTTKTSFVIDTQSENIYERSVRQGPMCYFDANSNNEIAAIAGPFETAYIVTPTYCIDCIGNKMKGDRITGYRAIKTKVKRQWETIAGTGIFDPRRLVYTYTAKAIWDNLDTWQREIVKNGEWKVGSYIGKFEEGHDGNNTVYRLLLPYKVSENEYVFISFFFSKEAGWHIVKFELMTHDYKVLGRTQAEYYTQNGIYVPKRITVYTFNYENQSIERIEDYIFTKQLLNKDIDKKTFTYKNLGLKNGDKFIDKIENKEFEYKDDKLVELTKKSAEEGQK